MAKQFLVSARDLVHEYPGVRALDGVSFEIERGSVTALVGPNGAGKSTLLRCLAGLDCPIEGTITVDSINVVAEPRLCHRRIGYLSDNFGLYDALTVRQCLAYAAMSQGIVDPEARVAVRDVAHRLALTNKLDQPAGSLSRGQRQRVAIGQALIHSPSVLILDEPASGLDPEARHDLAALFTTLANDGMTLIVSSHILAELDEYSTHMLVMRAGRIIESRALRATGIQTTDGQSLEVRVGFADVVPVDALLAAIEDATGHQPAAKLLRTDGNDAIIAIVGGDVGRASLLARLVAAGLPVLSYLLERENLHQSYLRSLRPSKHDRGQS